MAEERYNALFICIGNSARSNGKADRILLQSRLRNLARQRGEND